MDVDGHEDDDDDKEGEDEEDEGADTEEDEPAMSIDGDSNQGTPRKKKSKKKRSKLGQRKSQINVAAVASEQTALAELDTNLVLRLRLQKRYYVEALNFMRQIEGAMDIMEQLLGSTSKPEVLEAMEFFRVAYEYRFESAKVRRLRAQRILCSRNMLQVGIKKMIHLIWTKDNSTSTSEDGKEIKGVRSRLLECYRNLYFEPIPDPEMSAKDQINRIAKNMIEYVVSPLRAEALLTQIYRLTYEATLAELTSLEEMMRILMDEGHVHQDIISRLWAVYS